MKYMFHESMRIVEKQEKYEKIRAYGVIDSLEKNYMTTDKMLLAVDILIDKAHLEFDIAVLTKAKNILNVRKEKNEGNLIDNNATINGLLT
jgi:hypothetical protein